MKAVTRDVVVVGGGLLGLLVAELLAQRRRSVEVLVSPGPDPRSDSQRNHAWLHSGLFYPGNVRRMYYEGLEMLARFGFEEPTKQGVFRFSSVQELDAFLAHAGEIRLRGKVREVPDSEARSRLGVFFQPDRFLVEVPDAPFPVSSLMTAARERAKAAGARFQECRVRLERDEGAKHGYVVVADDERFAPTTTVACAGAGTPRLLRDLSLPCPLVVSQSVLLVVEDATPIRVPLLADRTSGLTVVSWNALESPPRGRLVVGAGEKRILLQESEDIDRSIEAREKAYLLSLLPPALGIEKRNYRFTAGHKTDLLVAGRPAVTPWIHAPEEFPGLVIGTPGKATLAFAVAKDILARIPKTRGPAPPTPPPWGSALWEAPIKSHFESDYDPLNERENDDDVATWRKN